MRLQSDLSLPCRFLYKKTGIDRVWGWGKGIWSHLGRLWSPLWDDLSCFWGKGFSDSTGDGWRGVWHCLLPQWALWLNNCQIHMSWQCKIVPGMRQWIPWWNSSFIYVIRSWKAKMGLPYHRKSWVSGGTGMAGFPWPEKGSAPWFAPPGFFCTFPFLSNWNNLVKGNKKCLAIVAITRHGCGLGWDPTDCLGP